MGLDAGGTKTFCLIGDETGRILGFGRAGSGNYETRGVEHAREQNRKAVEMALADASVTLDDLTAVGMGIAGADLPEDYEMLNREIFDDLFGSVRRDFQNDSMGGLRGGTHRPYGIVIAVGTGCVCAGKNPSGDHARTGGLGLEFGDECSGTDIGRTGLRRVWQARDEVIPPTLLTEKFVAKSGCSDVDTLFREIYHQRISEAELEPMAKLVFDAAVEGDAAACDILKEGGRYLGAMVNATARKLDMCEEAFEVVMAGSVFKGEGPYLVDAMRTVIQETCPRAETVVPIYEPVVGALLMAMDLVTEVPESLYDTLTAELIAAESKYGVRLTAE
jgi:N-acetylglucosamine kinase-like BadF-type ATPase